MRSAGNWSGIGGKGFSETRCALVDRLCRTEDEVSIDVYANLIVDPYFADFAALALRRFILYSSRCWDRYDKCIDQQHLLARFAPLS